MNNSGNFTRLLRIFSRQNTKIAGIIAATLIVVFCCVTAYYYITTPSNAIIITTADFPAGLSPRFTPENFTDHVVAHLLEMIAVADSSDVNDMARQEGFGPRAVRQTFIPIRALSNAPSPVFNQKWKGVSFEFCRSLGMSLRGKKFLELGVIGMPQDGSRLTASQKERPHFLAKLVGSAPKLGGACSNFEDCAYDLTEQILGSLDYPRLLNFYIKRNTKDANNRILDLYQAMPAASLQADDLVAWGNAFYGLGKFNDALRKYQEALGKDSDSCPAHIARGLVYDRREHENLLDDLRRAEQDFRTGIACNPNNEFALASLAHILLKKWVNSPNRDARWLDEAREYCEKALEINPKFVIAAVNLGYVRYRQGDSDALHYFEDLSQKYPTDSALFLNYGFLLYLEYMRDNKLDNKKEMLREATEQTLQSWKLSQNSAAAANNLGCFYYEQREYARAVPFWKKACDLNPSDPDCIAGLALGTYKLGDPTTAVALLSSAIKLDSHYRDPTYLKQHHDWSDRAASDLTVLLTLRPAGRPCSGS